MLDLPYLPAPCFILNFSPCSKDVRLPQQLQRAMAAEAEAAREARAKVIAAEGEHHVRSDDVNCSNFINYAFVHHL